MKIPIFAGARLIAFCTHIEAHRYADAPNVEIIRKRKTRQIVQVNLLSFGDESGCVKSRIGNPQKYTFLESLGEPVSAHCHSLKPHIADKRNWPIFRAALVDCLPAAAQAEIRELFAGKKRTAA